MCKLYLYSHFSTWCLDKDDTTLLPEILINTKQPKFHMKSKYLQSIALSSLWKDDGAVYSNDKSKVSKKYYFFILTGTFYHTYFTGGGGPDIISTHCIVLQGTLCFKGVLSKTHLCGNCTQALSEQRFMLVSMCKDVTIDISGIAFFCMTCTETDIPFIRNAQY